MTTAPYAFTPFEIGAIQGKISNALGTLQALAHVYPQIIESAASAVDNLESAQATIDAGVRRHERPETAFDRESGRFDAIKES